MKRSCFRLAMMLVIAAVFSGCTSSDPTVYPPEPLPEVLTTLPRQAKVLCRNDPALDRGSVVLWSLPGNGAPDPDSGVSGPKGDMIGAIEPCEPIQITDFYWDPYEAEYWVKIENNDLAGWLLLRFVSTE